MRISQKGRKLGFFLSYARVVDSEGYHPKDNQDELSVEQRERNLAHSIALIQGKKPPSEKDKE